MRQTTETARRDAGFTLVEMLAAIVVLALLTATVATGTGVATRLYRQSLFESQSEVLSSEVNTALADPIRFITRNDDGTYTLIYQDNDPDGKIVDAPANVRLAVEDGNGNESSSGYLYLVGKSSDGTKTLRLKLLNASAYGNCKVTVGTQDFASNPISITYTVTSTVDPSLSHAYTMTFGYDQDNAVTKVPVTS